MTQLRELENLHLDLRLKNWRNMNLRMLCFVPGANIVCPAGPEKIRIVALQLMKVAHQRSCWIGCFSQVIKNQGFHCQCWFVYDLSTGAVMVMQSTKDSSVETIGAVVQTLETWGHTDVVVHADGEPATKSLVRSIANARVH